MNLHPVDVIRAVRVGLESRDALVLPLDHCAGPDLAGRTVHRGLRTCVAMVDVIWQLACVSVCCLHGVVEMDSLVAQARFLVLQAALVLLEPVCP